MNPREYTRVFLSLDGAKVTSALSQSGLAHLEQACAALQLAALRPWNDHV